MPNIKAVNESPAVDVRKVLSGKDGCLYDGDGNMLATMESFTGQANVTNANFQPLGSAMERSSMTSYRVTLTMSEIVVYDSDFFVQIMKGLRTGIMPVFNFRGMIRSPYNGKKEQVVYRDCVPDGSIDIQNMTTGELYKRSWNFICNNPPELMSRIKSTD